MELKKIFNMGRSVAVLGLLYLCLPPVTDACSCELQHPQDTFCNADYVIKAKVKGLREVTIDSIPYQRYHIRISKVLKESEEFQSVKKIYAYTSAKGSCAVTHLKNGTKYLLEGKIKNNMLWLDTCHSQNIQEWSQMPVRQRKGYNYMYEEHCVCKVKVCRRPKCQKKTDEPTHCIWNALEDPGECYKLHSMCMNKNDTCSWSRPQLLKSCLEVEKEEDWTIPSQNMVDIK